MAESLLYYDAIQLNVTTQPQLAELIRWFLDRNLFDAFIAMVEDGTVSLYDYGFVTAPIRLPDGSYTLVNLQDEQQRQQGSFHQRFLEHESVRRCFVNHYDLRRLGKALDGHVTEAKADEFGSAVDDARTDLANSTRSASAVQALVDEIYQKWNLGEPPCVSASTHEAPDTGKRTIVWSIDLRQLDQMTGGRLNIHSASIFAGIAVANQLTASAASLNCDLYLPRPISRIVGNKLYEASTSLLKTRTIINCLQASVEFPDVRSLVNAGRMSFPDVLRIRKHSERFRKWLQSEAERDRDALVAYHHEVSEECGLVFLGRKGLQLFGVLGVVVVGEYLGNQLNAPTTGAAIGAGMGWLVDLGTKIGTEWRPVVFGEWFSREVQKRLIDANE
jgi:hypothetical protein